MFLQQPARGRIKFLARVQGRPSSNLAAVRSCGNIRSVPPTWQPVVPSEAVTVTSSRDRCAVAPVQSNVWPEARSVAQLAIG